MKWYMRNEILVVWTLSIAMLILSELKLMSTWYGMIVRFIYGWAFTISVIYRYGGIKEFGKDSWMNSSKDSSSPKE